jgi:signal recognition particle receptor subunit beta
VESLENLVTNLGEQNQGLGKMAYVVQYNKRDAPDAMSIAELREQVNPLGVPEFEASARAGVGVFETLKGLSRLVLTRLAASTP